MENEKAIARKPEEEKTVAPERHFDNQFDIARLLPTAGTLETTDEQKKILYAPVNEADVEIRPDGLVYLPWMEYVSRLNGAYGTQWSLIPNGNPVIKDDQIVWGFYLVVKGKLSGYAIGGQEYHPNNPKMNYTDAIEGAKSNTLMRLCKGLGISLELWKPSFIRNWKSKFAESYIGHDRSGKEKTFWKKKGQTTSSTPKPEPVHEPVADAPQEITGKVEVKVMIQTHNWKKEPLKDPIYKIRVKGIDFTTFRKDYGDLAEKCRTEDRDVSISYITKNGKYRNITELVEGVQF